MLDENHHDTAIGDAAQETTQTVGISASEARCGLVKQKDAWLTGQGPRDFDEAAIHVRQFGGGPVEGSGIADEGEEGGRGGDIASRACSEQTPGGNGEGHVVDDRQ